MEINSKDLYNILKEKGLKYIYHANTLKTSLHFLKEGKLVSRGNLSERSLEQTPQKTDKHDHITWNMV